MPTLAETPLPRILMGFARDGFEGQLTLRYGRTERVFHWQAGRPVAVDSNRPDDGLSALLVERGIIDEAAASRVRASAAAREKGELVAIAAAKLVSPKELLLGHTEHIRRGLIEAFGWPPEAICRFEHSTSSGGAPAVPIDVAEIVRTGLTRHWRPDQVLAELGDHVSAFPSPSAEPPEGPLDEVAAALLEACDGSRSSFSILRASSAPEQLAAFWWLDATGRLAWSDEPTARAEADTTDEAPQLDEAPAALGPEIEIVLSSAGDDGDAATHAAADSPQQKQADAKSDALRIEILELNERLSDISLYELLGIERGAKPAQIKKAYLKAAKRLHPDALSRMGLEDIKDEANNLFAEIAKAHTTLSDVDERRSYDATLDGHTAVDADQLAQAEMLFRKGEILMKAGSFGDAYELLDACVSLWPEEPEYHAALAWTLHRKTPPDVGGAIRHFERALELGNPNAQLLLRMSYAVKEGGDPQRAAELARDARQLDPQVRA